jgi:hypothetical protein
MGRLSVIVARGALLGTFGGVVTASPAFAGRGPKWHLVTAKPFTLPAAFCGFKIRVASPAGKEYFKLLNASDGSMTDLGTGSLKVSLTNPSTAKTITVNASGPAKVTTHAGGSVTFAGRGHGLHFLAPADAMRFGLPTVSVTTGRLTESIASDGSLTPVTLHGHVLADVRAALG